MYSYFCWFRNKPYVKCKHKQVFPYCKQNKQIAMSNCTEKWFFHFRLLLFSTILHLISGEGKIIFKSYTRQKSARSAKITFQNLSFSDFDSYEGFNCPDNILGNTPNDYGRFPHEYDCTLFHACYRVSTKFCKQIFSIVFSYLFFFREFIYYLIALKVWDSE